MRAVYNAESLIDAQMVADQLARRHIHAEIFGGYLQGGVGELPAHGLVRVLVNDDDAEMALRVVADWEREMARHASDLQMASQRGRMLGIFALGLLTGIAGTWLLLTLPASPNRVRYQDNNGDGKPDVWEQYRGGLPREIRLDRNFDGKVDEVKELDNHGRVVSAREDNDFDGRMETTISYHNGEPALMRVDSDGDNRVDTEIHFRDGLPHQIVWYDPEGRPHKRAWLKDGYRLQRAEIDHNSDGIPETEVHYDRYGEPVRSP